MCLCPGADFRTFEDLFGLGALYNCDSSGLGQPQVERCYQWFELYGGDLEWCPLVSRFRARPE